MIERQRGAEPRVSRWLLGFLAGLLGLLGGCSSGELPALPQLPITLPTGLPIPSLTDLPAFLQDLQLPDLSQISDLPKIEELPGLQTPPGAVAYAGPTELRLDVGQRIPGTDIELAAVGSDEAEFRLAGLRSVRRVGDSLDYAGPWPGIGGVQYALRLRIYRLGENHIRAGGVHRLLVENVQPTAGQPGAAPNRKFPFTAAASRGEPIPGTTYRFSGREERGAQLSGLPADDYPYFKIGDSIAWQGSVRSDIPARYAVRVLFYNDRILQVGGVVSLALP